MPSLDPTPPAETGTVPGERQVTVLQQDLFAWREQLARSIARNNLSLRSEDIATAVNQAVCRIIFLLAAEDRGLVPEGTLGQVACAEDRYRALIEATGVLEDLWTDLRPHVPPPAAGHNPLATDPAIDDRVMDAILGTIVPAGRPYGPARLSLEQIAGVLENYFRRTIRRSAAHQAVIVDRRGQAPAATASPGPAAIDYLVQATLGQAAADRPRREVLPLRIADPACGPGRILLCAFRHLTSPDSGCTFDERRQVLADMLHGVDADRHAVAAARMLLALALCTNGGARPGHDRTDAVIRDIAPVLRAGIRCGNPLIGPEIVDDASWAFCPARERHTLDPFDWDAAFPEIFAAGGFDAVICTPPGGPVPRREWIRQYYQRHYAAYDPEADGSVYFIEKGLNLVRPGGTFGSWTGNGWMRGRSGGALRSVLAALQPEEIVDLRPAGAGGDGRGLCLLRVSRRPPSHSFPVTLAGPGFSDDPAGFIAAHRFPVRAAGLDAGGWTFRDTRREDLVAKLKRAGMPLEEAVLGQVRPGTGIRAFRFVFAVRDVKDRLIRADPGTKPFIRPVVSAADIEKYRYGEDRFAVIIPAGWTDAHNRTPLGAWRWFRKRHPALARLLKDCTGETATRAGPGVYWWESRGEEDDSAGRNPSLLFPLLFRSPAFAYDPGRALPDETVGVIGSSNLYLLGLLNSRLTAFFLDSRDRSGPQAELFSWDDLRDLPVYTPDLDEPGDRARHDRIAALVTRMIELRKKLCTVHDENRAGRIKNEAAAIAEKIDAAVYDLYRLTKDETVLVESTALP